MRKITTLLLLGISSLAANAQLNILFVNDNDAFAYETDTMLNALSRTTYSASYFNAAASGGGPTATDMGGYDLVIWYAGVDGSGLQLWDGTDTEDPELNAFLDNGGSLWIMGSDVLYDAYGIAGPTSFNPGDMLYDHCGIASYDSQSYADDGSLGCAQLDLNTTLPTVGPSTLTWIYPTTWYIDGVTPVAGAERVYEMGGTAGYPLLDAVSGLYFEEAFSGSRVMTYLFNPAEITTSGDQLADFLQRHLDFWAGILASRPRPTPTQGLKVWPNPTADVLHMGADTAYEVRDAAGRVLLAGNGSTLDVEDLPQGLYMLHTPGGSTRFVRQ